MKKIILATAAAFIFVFLATASVKALPNLSDRLPNTAKTASQAVDDSGQVKAPPEFVSQLPESQLTKVVFIRYKPGFQKDKPCNNNGVCDTGEKGWCSDCKTDSEDPVRGCYDFFSGSKPRWNWIEDYVYNDMGLGNASSQAVETWETAAPRDIFGTGDFVLGYDWGTYDYINSISYGDYGDPYVIAVTAIWYRGKNIYEYDIMFDEDYFPGIVDLDTVVLHEFGHAVGLADLYDTVCTSEVMYGVYDGVDLDLGPGDAAGVQKLYK